MTWLTPDTEEEDRPPLVIWTRKQLDQEARNKGRAPYGMARGRKHVKTKEKS